MGVSRQSDIRETCPLAFKQYFEIFYGVNITLQFKGTNSKEM